MRMLAKLFAPLPQVLKPNEIVPGHDKPTIILAHMFAAEMLSNLEVTYEENISWSHKTDRFRASFPSFHIIVQYAAFGTSRWAIESLTCKEDLGVTFEKPEQDIILDAFQKFVSLRRRHEKMAKEEKRQQAAIDAIAKICKIPTEEAKET